MINRSAIADKPRFGKKYKCEKRACNTAQKHLEMLNRLVVCMFKQHEVCVRTQARLKINK